MAKGKLEDFDTPDGFRRFLQARGSVTVKEAASQLQLSRASYYRLVNMFVERLYGTQEPTQDKPVEPTAPWFHEALLKTVEQHPDWGCYRLAEALSAVQKISGPTVQKELARLDLATRERRFAKKERDVLDTPGGWSRLGEDDRHQLIENNPYLADRSLLENHPKTEVFAARVLTILDSDGIAVRLLLVVNLNSSYVFLENLCVNDASSDLERVRALTEAYPPVALGHRNAVVIVPANSGLKPNTDILADLSNKYPRITMRFKNPSPVMLRTMARQVKKEVANWCSEIVNAIGAPDVTTFLRFWANEHNHHPRLGFPTFGISPNERMDEMTYPDNK